MSAKDKQNDQKHMNCNSYESLLIATLIILLTYQKSTTYSNNLWRLERVSQSHISTILPANELELFLKFNQEKEDLADDVATSIYKYFSIMKIFKKKVIRNFQS